ncbi:keratin-associated protein 9-1-like [Coccinella septempunctata]|uniref:keratin-associated protein 9-1-like n=1 Tax=Coccinella septempunctata TaxID=41139 RepID=UPI001D068BAD|nr:keratin-associated protein 9-1-like [Coccinella septempunctata]
MGKSCDVSKQRKCLMKTLKKLSEKLQCSPPCHVKPYPCTPCCPMGAFLPCGPPKCKCFLMKNCCQKASCCSTSSCGPFPDSCTSICCPSSTRCISKCSCCNPCCLCTTSKYCRSSKCCKPKRCGCSCGCKPCFPLCYPCPKMCKYTCCHPCCCCRRKCIQYSPTCCRKTCKKSPVGNLCFGCNTICIPRCSSDSCLVTRNRGKALSCSKSVELRGGKLYRGCDCDKKNGLQDRCLRYCCINNPKCRTQPASCHCSKFSCGKHLSVRYGKKKTITYTCCMCGPPMYPCMPCYQTIPCQCRCRCSCCCRNKCENDCQCCPITCEAACCCQPCPEPCVPSPEPCLPCPEPCSLEPCCPSVPCPEPCCPAVPCPEPCEPCPPCYETNSPSPPKCVCPYEDNCTCDGDTQTYGNNDGCYIEYSPPQCRACQTHY